MRTADEVRRRYARLMEEHGVTLQQYNVLRILRGAGPEGLPTLTIGDRMIERTPGVTRLIDRMVRRGWVERERCREDRRRVWCRVTEAGLGVLEGLDGPVRTVDNSIFDVLSEEEMDDLVTMLDRIRAHMSEDGEV
jgi:DNA-binding MarR family transcriptional regulator